MKLLSSKTNTFKNTPPPPTDDKPPVFQSIKDLKLEVKIDNNIGIRYLPRFLFLTFLGIIYIANVHYAEKMIHRFAAMERSVEQLRVDFSSLKYEYINASRQKETAERVARLGLTENDQPIIELPKSGLFFGK
jgi:hypothetical protein